MAKSKKLTTKQLDKQIGEFWNIHGNGIVVNMMDIPKIFKDARAAYEANQTLQAVEDSVRASAIKYSTTTMA